MKLVDFSIIFIACHEWSSVVFNNKNGLCALTYELPNDLTLYQESFETTGSYSLVPSAPLNSIQDGPFGAAHGYRGAKRSSLSKICHTYLTLMKLGTGIPYLKKIQKAHKSCDTPLESCWHQHFITGNQQFLLYQEIHV